ncbi:MAG: NAD(P)-binding domain-containing protein [Thermoplasmata archaeon]|nr:NAD(P)-binding domain-containing protein [Thermoplasmata archaeon]
MRVGVLGSGDVGRMLGRGFVAKGHEVMIGSRSPKSEALQTWRAEVGAKGSTGTFAESATFGELLVLSVQGAAVATAIDLAGPESFAGKIVLDTTNALDFSKGMPPGLFVGLTDSLGEQIQRKLPKARVVKCFNIVPNSLMVDPKVAGGPPDMMICGNDVAAKARTVEILKAFGWPGAIDLGGIENARWLEALVPLWVRVAASLNAWNSAFKILRG